MTGSHPDGRHKKKRKDEKFVKRKKIKRQDKKEYKYGMDDDGEYDSDLDLERTLKPVAGYMKNRETMIQHMFKCIQGHKLKGMLPEVLKSLSLHELKKLCLEQLEIMSKKRIHKILEGVDPGAISSSGTEEESSDDASDEAKTKAKTESHAADSTSQTEAYGGLAQAAVAASGDEAGDQADEDILVDDEPEDFDLDNSEEGYEYVDLSDEYAPDQIEDSDIEFIEGGDHVQSEQVECQEVESNAEGEDDILNESIEEGELEEGEVRDSDAVVKKKQMHAQVRNKNLNIPMKNDDVKAKVVSLVKNTEESDMRQIVTTDVAYELKTAQEYEVHVQAKTAKATSVMDDVAEAEAITDEEDDSDDGINVDIDYKVVAREKKLPEHSQAGISSTQMEILELEMRARAIKAMLKATEIKEKRVRMVQKHKLAVKQTREVITQAEQKKTGVQTVKPRSIIVSSQIPGQSSEAQAKRPMETRVIKLLPKNSATTAISKITKPKTDAKVQSSSKDRTEVLAGAQKTTPQVSTKVVTSKVLPCTSTDTNKFLQEKHPEAQLSAKTTFRPEKQMTVKQLVSTRSQAPRREASSDKSVTKPEQMNVPTYSSSSEPNTSNKKTGLRRKLVRK